MTYRKDFTLPAEFLERVSQPGLDILLNQISPKNKETADFCPDSGGSILVPLASQALPDLYSLPKCACPCTKTSKTLKICNYMLFSFIALSFSLITFSVVT